MGEEAADLDWRRLLSAWERCKAKKGGLATWETFGKKCISYNKWTPSSNMRIICVQTGFPDTHLTEWKFMQNLRKCRSVLPHSSDLVWTSPTKKESTLNKNSILWSHLWQRSLQTKCTILCSISSLTEWRLVSHIVHHPGGILYAIVAQNRVSNFFSGSAMSLNKECQFSWSYFLWCLTFFYFWGYQKWQGVWF